MKKIIAFCLISFALNSQTQVTPNGTMTLFSSAPYNVCQCDSVKIGVKFKSTTTPDNTQALFHLYMRYGYPTYQYVTIRSFLNPEFYQMDKAQGQLLYDTIYYFKYKIPCNFVALYGGSVSSGAYAEFCLDYFSSSIAKPVSVGNCTTGIPQYIQGSDKPAYRDFFNGSTIEQKKNEPIIEQKGTFLRKIVIQE